jgi:DNA replication protein DnaC
VENIMKYDVVLLDDLDKLKAAKNQTKSGWASERMFSMFDSLINNGKIVISTTNVQDLNELNDFFDSSVVSRLIGNSEVIKMKGNDYRIIEREGKLKNAGLSKNN